MRIQWQYIIFLFILIISCSNKNKQNEFKEIVAVDFLIIEGMNGITISRYRGAGQDVIIPKRIYGKSVVRIGEGAKKKKKLTSVAIPNSVTSIGDYAFSNNLLSSVIIPNSVTDIGLEAFSNNQLSSVTIGKSVNFIGSRAFSNNLLTNVIIPDSVTRIRDWAFSYNQLTDVVIGNSVRQIEDYAFYGNQLINVNIPDSVTSIGNYVFNAIDDQEIILSSAFSPKHYLVTRDVFEKSNTQTAQVNGFTLFSSVEVLGNNGNTQWVRIRDNHRTGWCLTTGVNELPIKYNPMNNIDIEYLILENIANNRFKIEGRYGDFSSEYGMNMISISFYRRNERFDIEEIHPYEYNPNDYRTMELSIENDINTFPQIYFGSHNRKNNKNGITFVDSFMFSAHEGDNHSIWRVIYFSTNNYDIKVTMFIPDTSYSNELIRQIMTEAPQYFGLYPDEPYIGGDIIGVYWIHRDDFDAIKNFGEDLLNDRHTSQTLNMWFAETEKILAGLRIE